MDQRVLDEDALLGAQLQAGQAGANTAGMQALGSAAASRNRAMQAAQLMGQQSSLLRGQDYQQASDKAKAQDMVNHFNSSMAMQTQAMNLNQKQRDFENRMRKLQGYNQSQSDLGHSYVNQAGANVPLERDAWSKGGQFVDNMIDTTMSAYGQSMGGGGGGGFDIGELMKKFGGGSGSGSTWT